MNIIQDLALDLQNALWGLIAIMSVFAGCAWFLVCARLVLYSRSAVLTRTVHAVGVAGYIAVVACIFSTSFVDLILYQAWSFGRVIFCS
jgi:hypothetical protein